VCRKIYDECRMKQQIKIQKATLTLPIQRIMSKYWAYFSRAYLMKDDVKVKVPNRTPKILIPLDGVVN
jgi:hypothetical protein